MSLSISKTQANLSASQNNSIKPSQAPNKNLEEAFDNAYKNIIGTVRDVKPNGPTVKTQFWSSNTNTNNNNKKDKDRELSLNFLA